MTLNINELVRGGTICLSKVGLAEGNADHGFSILEASGAGYITYAINGIMYVLADAVNVAPTACAEQALGTTCLYLVTLTAGGTLDTIKGVEVDNDELAAGNAVLHWPTPAVDTCPIGAVKVAAGTTAFTVGVDDLTDDIGTGTVTYYDLLAIPAAPLTS